MRLVMKRKLSYLQIIIPVYNEEAGILEFYKQITSQLQTLNIHYGLIFIDDGTGLASS